MREMMGSRSLIGSPMGEPEVCASHVCTWPSAQPVRIRNPSGLNRSFDTGAGTFSGPSKTGRPSDVCTRARPSATVAIVPCLLDQLL